MANITLIQGDSIGEKILITDRSNVAVDITGGTVKFRIVEDPDDLKAAAIYNNDAVTITNATIGEATLTITRAVTKLWTPGLYKWEVEYIDSGGGYSHTGYSNITIEKSIYSDDT